MGKRKKLAADARKEARKAQSFAKLNNVPSSPRKMRYASADVEKVLRSAIANWEQKNERKAEDGELFITKIYVNEGATLKRMRPAPQGRGYRIRKRSNHVTLFVDTKKD